ncbi:MAG: NAD(P)H-dependent glycerol-3-phosphate dehydrogenase [Bacilli bacterium]
MNISILGTGAYGMALASIFYYNRCKIKMWTNSEDEKKLLLESGKSNKIDYVIPKDITISTDLREVIFDANIIVIAIPTAFVEDISREIKTCFKKEQVIVIASKGIEQNSCMFLYDIVRNNIKTSNIAIISGGTFAADIVKKVPIGLSLATRSDYTKNLIIKAMENDYVKLRYTRDIIGTEICGAIKNVIAIAAGMIDGMGYPDSTSAMFITESLHDIKNLIKALGGNKNTILSFAGFGDLLLTCTSDKSRNYTLGKIIGENRPRKEIDDYIKSTTIEGLYTLKSIKKLLKNRRIKMPIIDLIYNIIINEKDPQLLVKFLIEKE